MEKDRYLEANEQLILGAKVNRVGDLLPGEPAIFHLLSDTQDIVKSVKNRVESSVGIDPFEHTHRKKPKRGFRVLSASTGAGNINLSIGNESHHTDLDDNPYIYRVGKYVITRHEHGPYSEIIILPYMLASQSAREVIEENDQYTPVTTIAYVTETGMITGIVKFEGEEPITIWEYRKPSTEIKPLRPKNLLYLKRLGEATKV